MKKFLTIPALIAVYISLIIPFSAYVREKPFVEKLGYIPQAEVLKFAAADQKTFLADCLVLRSLFYFGTLVGKSDGKFQIPPDYFSLYKTIETALKLNPYNLDAYYFAQAVMVWDAKRVKEANALLEYGMKYRNWDYQLPFYLGFNYGYFLKDYRNAAKYYQIAADLINDPLLARLAGRYMYESGQTDLALAYLETMEKSARNAAIKKEFQVRIAAFREVKRAETAITEYKRDIKAAPASIDDLLRTGYLKSPPVDPYGGKFFIDEKGRVQSTSKFAFAGGSKAGQQRKIDESH